MNTEEGFSLFGNLLGGAIGWWAGGPMGASIGASLVGGAFGSWAGASEQEKQQKKLAEAQKKQSEVLRRKLKADTAELHSAVQSSVLQTSGAMGAIY